MDDGSTMYSFGAAADDQASKGSNKAETPPKAMGVEPAVTAPKKQEAAPQVGDGGVNGLLESTSKQAQAKQEVKAVPAEASGKDGRKETNQVDGGAATGPSEAASEQAEATSAVKAAPAEAAGKDAQENGEPTRRRSTDAPKRVKTSPEANAPQQPAVALPSLPPPQAQAPPAPPQQHTPRAAAEYAEHALPRVALVEQLGSVAPSAQQASQNGAATAVAEPPAAKTNAHSASAAPAGSASPGVDATHAKKEADKVEVPAPAADAGPDSAAREPAGGLSKLTVKELKALCKERGVTGYSTLRKAALVARLHGTA